MPREPRAAGRIHPVDGSVGTSSRVVAHGDGCVRSPIIRRVRLVRPMAHGWNPCWRSRASRVRIPHPPPSERPNSGAYGRMSSPFGFAVHPGVDDDAVADRETEAAGLEVVV